MVQLLPMPKNQNAGGQTLEELVVTYQHIVEQGKYGPYVVTTNSDHRYTIKGSITFLVSAFPEIRNLGKGTLLVVIKLSKKPNGWRAKEARVYTLSDEERINKQIAKTKKTRHENEKGEIG